MTDLRTAAQQLLDACEQRLPLQGQAAIIDELNALRAALAEPVQEPVQEPFALPCPTPKACKAHCCSGHCIPRSKA